MYHGHDTAVRWHFRRTSVLTVTSRHSHYMAEIINNDVKLQLRNIASIDIEDFLLSTIMLGLELAKFYTQDCALGVAHSIHICTLKILFQAHLVHAANLKAVITFFRRCPRYANVRNTYLSSYLHTHSVQELLHGKVTATDEDNETMFCHVQEFIVKSKRFL